MMRFDIRAVDGATIVLLLLLSLICREAVAQSRI